MRVAMYEALATVTVISCEHTYIARCVYVPACACVRAYMCGLLLHVPITKYKIIPNSNPNPNTKMTVNTIPKQM